MKIETKYNIGDEVWVRSNNQPTIAKVVSVLVNRELIKVKGQSRIYEIEKYGLLVDNCVYGGVYLTSIVPTQEELLKSL